MYSYLEVKKQIDEFSLLQNWMHNFEVYPDIWTIKPRRLGFSCKDSIASLDLKFSSWQRKGYKLGVIYELSKKFDRILDIACGEGLYSFISSFHTSFVLGIDIDTLRIQKANFCKSVMDINNIQFENIDIFSQNFNNVGNFDIAFCLGIIHRIPDIFNFVNIVSSKVDTILFEFIHAPKIFSPDIPFAYHAPGGLYEQFNSVSNFEDQSVARHTRAGGGADRAAYLYMTYGFLESLCYRAGFKYYIRLCEVPFYIDLSNTDRLSRRVFLLASKYSLDFFNYKPRLGLNKSTLKKLL